MASYSKAPRGLSVQLRVTSVFTGLTTSPSPSSRQRSARYAIRAGRNLPDKEFRLDSYSPVSVSGRWRITSPLHVTMQMGPYLRPVSRMPGVWSLRILMSSVLGFLRFIR